SAPRGSSSSTTRPTQLASPQEGSKSLDGSTAGAFADAEGRRDGRRHELCIGDGHEIDDSNAVAEARAELVGRPQGTAGLAGAAGARQGHDTYSRAPQEAPELPQLLPAADE